MKLHKFIQRTAAAAVVGAMALSISLPALAATWSLSNQKVTVENGKVSSEGTELSAVAGTENEPGVTLTGSGRYIVLKDSSLTMSNFEARAYSGASDNALTINSDATLTIQGTENKMNTGGSGVKAIDAEGKTLTITGTSADKLSIVPINCNSTNGIRAERVHIQGGVQVELNTNGMGIEAQSISVEDNSSLTIRTSYDAPFSGTLKVAPNAKAELWSDDIDLSKIDREDFRSGRVICRDENGSPYYGVTVYHAGNTYCVTEGNKDTVFEWSTWQDFEFQDNGSSYTLLSSEKVYFEGENDFVVDGSYARKPLDVKLDGGVTGGMNGTYDMTMTGVRDVTVGGEGIKGSAAIECSGTVEIQGVTGTLTYEQAEGKKYKVILNGEELEELQTGKFTAENIQSIQIIPQEDADDVPGDTGGDAVEDTSAADAAGAMVAGVVIGGAAVWGGYEIATRVILNQLLPEGAAVPKNQGELALLLWNTAGRPEPAAEAPYADDTAKAAQWCVEQGWLDSTDTGRWTPKFRVIEVWNKAFPRQ